MLYAAIANKLDIWLWIGYGFVFLEGLTLLAFKSHRPLNLMARKYTSSAKANFGEYSVRDRILNPLYGEVGWEYPEELRLYFKENITKISYEFTK